MTGTMIALLAAIALATLAGNLVEALNLSRLDDGIPTEFEGYYDAEKYRRAQEYLRTNTRFGFIRSTVSAALLIAFIAFGGFGLIDQFARSFGFGSIVTGLLFTGTLGLLTWALGLPFNLFHTFVIEERFGFNRTKPMTFAIDQVKGLLLGGALAGLALGAVFWFFERTGSLAWFWSWIGVTTLQLALFFIAPVVFLPLFNKFTPLPEGELKTEIERYARSQDFKLQGIFSMDGSKRSSKANAFFTGFGKFRRIVLFDTLIKSHGTEELVAVLAHEIGHFRRRHIPRQMMLSIAAGGLTFWLLSLCLGSSLIYEAFGLGQPSIYAGLVFFGILYSPISRVISLYSLHLSRKYEFEADAFARETYGNPEKLATALKKLSVDSLSNLRPHPLKVFLQYTHPPVMQRLERLRT